MLGKTAKHLFYVISAHGRHAIIKILRNAQDYINVAKTPLYYISTANPSYAKCTPAGRHFSIFA